MTEFALYLESGPKRRKTMVHVFEPLGCMANGPTSEEAIAAAPEAIRAYLRFLKRVGEPVEEPPEITTCVAEHITQGQWLGNGSPNIVFAPDLEPVTEEELRVFVRRLQAIRETIAGWAATQSNEAPDAPAQGRTARAILLHVLGPTGAYLSPVIGTVSGVSRLHTQAERGEIPIPDALRQATALTTDRLAAATAEDRHKLVQRPNDVRTLPKAIRRSLEHDWEHLAELSRRPGGPKL